MSESVAAAGQAGVHDVASAPATGRSSRYPTAALLTIGLACGPQGLGLLSPGALTSLDQATPVALAILGALGGLSVARLEDASRRLVWATGLDVAFTMASVGIWIGAAFWLDLVPGVPFRVAFGVVCMVAAASSLLLPRTDDRSGGDELALVAEAGVVIPIIVGGVALAVFRERAIVGTVLLVAQAAGAVLMLAVAAWLLVGSASSDTERRVFTVAAVMLVGGAADYLSLSALLGGFLAGAAWHALAGAARDGLREDILYVRQPFVAVVLLLAGANTWVSVDALILAGLYASARAAGKIAGAGLATRISSRFPAGAGWRLLSPGVFGVAFALNARRAVGPDLALALDVVTLGTIAADLITALAQRRGRHG